MITTPRPQANVLLARRLVTRIAAPDLRAELECERSALRIFDVRPLPAFRRGHVAGATRLALRRSRVSRRIRRDHVSVLYGSDARDDTPYLVGWELADAGFPVVVLEGGFASWRKVCGEEHAPELAALFAVLRIPQGAGV